MNPYRHPTPTIRNRNAHILIFASVVLLFCLVRPLTFAQEDEYLIHTLKGHSDLVNSIGLYPDGRFLVSGSKDRSVIVWDLEQYKELFSIEDNSGDIQFVTFSPDGEYILGSARNVIMIWTMEGEYINSLKGHATAVWSMDFSSDGKRIVSGSFDRNFRLWDFTNLTELNVFKGHSKSVLAVAFHPSGNYIATGSLDETIRLWEAGTGSTFLILRGHTDNIYSLDFSPNGKFLASSSRDKTIKLWDLESGELIRTFEGHSEAVSCVKFSPEGDHLLSGSYDQTIKLWEAPTGNCLYTFTGHEGNVSCLSFMPESDQFASGSFDQTVKIWNLDPAVYVNYYFKEEIDKEMAENPLFAERSNSESRQEYSERMLEAGKFKQQLYENYYQKYLQQLKSNSLNNRE